MHDDLLPGSLQATFWPAARVPGDGHLALWGVADIPAAAGAIGLPPGEVASLPTVLPRTPRARSRVVATDVPARVVPVLPAARALAALTAPGEWPAWRRPSDAVLAWSLAAKLAFELVAAGRLVPGLRAAGPHAAVAGWRSAPAGDGRLVEVAAVMSPAAHALRRDEDDSSVCDPLALVSAFCDAVADACVRAAAVARAVRPDAGWAERWVTALAADDPRVHLDGAVEATELADRIAAWTAPLARHDAQAAARLCVQLDTPGTDAADEPWPLTYLLQAADDPSLVVPADEVWSQASATLELLDRRVGDPQEALVRGLAEAARLFPPIDASLSEARPAGLDLDPGQAADFLTGGAETLAAAGLGVLLPAELTATGARRLRARLVVGAATPDPGAGLVAAGLNADRLADFRWEVALGDETLSPEEFAQIVALKQPLVRWRGRWVRVDPDEALRLAGVAGDGGRMGVAEALAAALVGARDDPVMGSVEVVAAGGVADLVERVRAAARAGSRRPRLDGIDATLRDYQRRGVAWLQTMAGLGLGAVLADDMGLGKTLQTIALLADRDAGGPHLVVCPTSVVGNWERELARFAPGLPVVRHHGAERAGDAGSFRPGAVVVTSYGLVRRDVELLAGVDWDVVVLDEAQQVKNHAAKAAKAVRRLPATVRVALTGTPVENRLSELWSIMDWCNPGLLGGFDAFKERYAIPVERWRDADATTRLRRLVAPFLLRRLKRDVATDLPDKLEAVVACSLTPEQATLYQAAVEHAFADDGLGEGIERRGRILALLTALKQVCNHPAQYLAEAGPLPRRSGKLARTGEILAEALDAGERALVFTQYRRMGELLARYLPGVLGLPEVPFLHGGVPRARRDAMVDAFQAADGPPVLLVSLKAGGTGLNLTRATQVVHYDRWWNPAVEDQATDRAYRIGQTRTVTVHKLVTAGTLEERIAGLLEEKRALADAVIGAGEAWLTEMSDGDLWDLVALSSADVADEEAAA